MTFSPTQLQTLRAELDADPLSIGYGAMSDGATADALNLKRPDQEPDHPHIRRTVVPMNEVHARINWQEVAALAAGDRQAFAILMSGEQLDISSDPVRAALGSWFPTGGAGTTREMLGEYQDRDASRAEILFGIDAAVSHLDVAAARAL